MRATKTCKNLENGQECRKHISVVPGCTLLTGDAHIVKKLLAEREEAEADVALKEKRVARKEKAAANKMA